MVQQTDPEPGQWLARYIIRSAQLLTEIGIAVEIHWVPDHIGVEASEMADTVSKNVVEKAGIRRCPEQFTTLANV